jgi:hypothetical protein
MDFEGFAELSAKLSQLADPKDQKKALAEAVRTPMRQVMLKARGNLTGRKISPGNRKLHLTYRGRYVSSGFASRNLRVIVKHSRQQKGSATAILSTRKEAYYVLQFHELGTRNLRKREWLVPAFESAGGEMVRGVGAVMRARIDRIAKARAAGAKPGTIRPPRGSR